MNEGGKMTEIISEDQLLTEFAVREHRSLWLDAWRRLISNRTAILGLVIVAKVSSARTWKTWFIS